MLDKIREADRMPPKVRVPGCRKRVTVNHDAVKPWGATT